MARVTVEDCVTKIPNRFELVTIAAQRARAISAGSELTLEPDDDKNPVLALREIAEQTVNFSELQETIIRGLQKHIEIDEPEEEEMDLLAIQQEVNGAMNELIAPQGSGKKLAEDEDEAASDDTVPKLATAETPAYTDDIKDIKDIKG